MLTRSILEFLTIILLLYGIYKEDALIAWERKVWQYIKAFFKVLKMEVKERWKKTKRPPLSF